MATSSPSRRPRIVGLLALSLLAGCGRGEGRVFELLDAKRTGVTFANTLTASDSLNEHTDVYFYNGAGVAVGDVDGDGLPDLFFAGNMVSSRLYRNSGEMHFEDVTDRAGVRTSRWATGATMADVNGDGALDIYVSVSGPPWSTAAQRANLLFVNDGHGRFAEMAASYGVADTGYTTHAAFLDYDGDGCLDLFLLENAPQDFSRGVVADQPSGGAGHTPGSYNQLYRNDCKGHFTNVSAQAGILRNAGFGLGVAVGDVNLDGRPDIYVSNDGLPNDVLYVNNGDGTFTDRAPEWLRHASQAGMGVDIADFNDDGWPDVLQVDMLPRAAARRKRTMGYVTYGSLLQSRSRGFRDDYSANALQLNNGTAPSGAVVFSEIGRLAGLAATDWSWSPLFADFDNDGRKDVFIGNGYPKAVNDLDYVPTMFAALRRGSTDAGTRNALALLNALPPYDEPNFFFRNTGDLGFTDVSQAWGGETPSFSYGAAYADLDNDGRLDLVVNNIDAPAFVYHNVQRAGDAHHWLTVALHGDAPNTRGIGATVVVTAGGHKQYVYQSPSRGFMSSVDDRPHFGLGPATRIDSLEVFWPDGRYQLLAGPGVDRLLVVKQGDARERRPPAAELPAQAPLFQRLDPKSSVAYVQRPAPPTDFGVQGMLPYMISRHGPAIAVADADGDGLEDVFVGGGNGVAAKLFLQRKDGTFTEAAGEPWAADSALDDWGALFFDANGDGRPDLYVARGGYQLAPEAPQLQDRLYVNRGAGRFVLDSAALPTMLTSTATVRAADFDGDGDLDLFVGGRLTPRGWPAPTRSYILRNDRGRFIDVTEQVAPALVHPGGMITDAAWVDLDGDGRPDLVTVGEWMPITFYRNDGGRLRDVTAETKLPPSRGWWYSLAAGDFDGDGRVDLVAGNLGLNYSYTTSANGRFGVYAGDFTGRRATDVVLTQELGGKDYPYAGLTPLGRQIYTLGVKFPTHGAFAEATMSQLFGAEALKQAVHFQADTFASVVLHNEGTGRFTLAALPMLAQISPIRGIVPCDVDGDGKLDLVVAGNLYDTDPNIAPADAGNGLWLRGDGRGHFIPVPARESGFLAARNATGLALLKMNTGVGIIVANAGDSLQTFAIRKR